LEITIFILREGEIKNTMQLDQFLLILRILFVVLLYLFLMQVVIAITRDLRKTAALNSNDNVNGPPILGRLVVINTSINSIPLGTLYNLEPLTSIGRGPTNTICIRHESISTEHAWIRWRNGTWYVEDLGSRNGTFMNDQPVPLLPKSPVPVRPGDTISIGAIIKFQLKQ
jgi:pSer/pThr/pTyr-binding forkhead associated (FHA) protein